MGYSKLSKIPLSLPIQLRSSGNFKLKILGYQLVIPTCIINKGYPKMATIRLGVFQIIKKNPSNSVNSTKIFMKF